MPTCCTAHVHLSCSNILNLICKQAHLPAIQLCVPVLRHCRYSKDRPRLGDTLEVIKFVCKEFWQAIFKKQIDNLKTNHRVSKLMDCTYSCISTLRWLALLCSNGMRQQSWRCFLQGIYVLQDNNFRWLVKVAPVTALPDGTKAEYLTKTAQSYLHLPCGILRGTVSGDSGQQ